MAGALDTELTDLPQALRWREWMARVEAVLFAAAEPVGREVLARVVGRDCALDLLIEDIAADLAERPYAITRAAGGWQLTTRARHAEAIRAALGERDAPRDLTPNEALVLTIIAYMQPVTRGAIARLTGREVSRDLIARLHAGQFAGERPEVITYGVSGDEAARFGLPCGGTLRLISLGASFAF